MPSNDPLAAIALDQKRWSLTADALKASIVRARWLILYLSIAGAVLETSAAQIRSNDARLAKTLGYGGAAVLAAAAVVRQFRLGQDRSQAWILARAGAESLKREMYLFLASAGPYASDIPALTLVNRKDQILDKLQGCQPFRVEPKAEVAPPGPLDVASYLDKRITGQNGQINYFTKKAERYSQIQDRLNYTEFGLAVAAALLGAAATFSDQQAVGAWVAVVTTITGAITSHALAQRYEPLIISFRATADRLQSAAQRWSAKGSGNLAELVEACEAILLDENQGWIAGTHQTSIKSAAASGA